MASSPFALRLASESAAVWSLEQIAREGARLALEKALEDEVAQYLQQHRTALDEQGHRLVVRNGHKPPRKIASGLGPIEIEQPRVDDRRVDETGVRFRFTSKILPPYLRKTKVIEELVPWLYLKGISSNDMSSALIHLGFDGAGLSPASVGRMKELWVSEYEYWCGRDLSGKRYAYIWVDGLHFNVRLSDERPCVLVIMGASEEGRKELIAIYDGLRESEQSWLDLLRDLKARGLTHPPKLAVADGALGFWAALNKEFPSTAQQRCWVHKMANVLNKLPKSLQPTARNHLHHIWLGATREEALQEMEKFVTIYQAKHPGAVKCLLKDKDHLLAFYDFPAEHWSHLRTTNAIESTFATVQLRSYRTKGPGSREAGLAMVFKLAQQAEKRWRRINGPGVLADLVAGAKFIDGVKQAA